MIRQTMSEAEYLKLRKKSDAASMDELHTEALGWDSLQVAPGSYRRNYDEDFQPGDTTIYPADAYQKGILF